MKKNLPLTLCPQQAVGTNKYQEIECRDGECVNRPQSWLLQKFHNFLTLADSRFHGAPSFNDDIMSEEFERQSRYNCNCICRWSSLRDSQPHLLRGWSEGNGCGVGFLRRIPSVIKTRWDNSGDAQQPRFQRSSQRDSGQLEEQQYTRLSFSLCSRHKLRGVQVFALSYDTSPCSPLMYFFIFFAFFLMAVSFLKELPTEAKANYRSLISLQPLPTENQPSLTLLAIIVSQQTIAFYDFRRPSAIREG